MHPSSQRTAVFAAVLVVPLTCALAVALLVGALRLGMLPSFDRSLPTGARGELVLQSGAYCRPELPRLACQAGVRREELRVLYAAGDQRALLLSVSWDRR